jgi:tetratricopeptide (TPR) repeat protein
MLAYVGLAVVLIALETGMVGAADRRYVELSTPQLTLVSAAGETETQQIALRIEMFRAAVELALGVSLPTAIHTRIYALSGRDWKQYAQPRRGVGGYFISHPASSDLMFNVDDADDSAFELIFHEYVHHILRTSWAGEVPPFLDEGLAEVFSTAHFDKGTVRLEPRHDYIQLLRTQDWLPLERLLDIRRHDPEYVEHNLAPAFYAQAWATMYYIMAIDREAGARAVAYFRDLREGSPDSRAAELFAGASDKDVNRAIAAFIRRRERLPIAQLAVSSDPARRTSAPRKLDHQGSTLAIGELLLRFGNRHHKARELFDEALRRQPQNLRARIGLAWSHLQASEWAQAATLLDQTTAADVDAPTAVALGRGLYQLVASTNHTDPLDDEQLARLRRARAYFDSAMRDKRMRIEAISGYVLASLALGESGSALIVLAEVGYRSAPRSSDLAVALAILHALDGHKETARGYWHEAARNTHTGPLRTRILSELQRAEEDLRQPVP